MASKLPPLNERQVKDRAAVVLAYADWWNHLKFKKGWATPLFTFNEVKPLLERAAEIVIRTRSVLDKHDPSFKLRMVDGAAREFLWTLTKKPTPASGPKFVRDLVHATFRDGKGFVEGLTRDQLDEYIKQFDPALNVQELQVEEKREAVFEKLASSWASANATFDSLLKECRAEGNPSSDALADEHDLTKLIHHVTDLEEATRGCMERFKRRRLASPAEAAVPSKKHKKKRSKHGRHGNTQPAAAGTHADAEAAMDTDSAPASATESAPASHTVSGALSSEPIIEEVTSSPAPAVASTPATETGANEIEDEHSRNTHDTHDTHDGEDKAVEEQSDSSDDESDTAKSSADEQQNFTIKVQQVKQDVDIITHGVSVLSEEMRDLDAKLPANPDEAQAVLRKLRGRASQFTDSLLRDMTVLDALSLTEDLRPVRKTQIQAIERLVDTVETISQKLKDLSSLNDAKLQDKRKVEAAVAAAAAQKAAAEAEEAAKAKAAAAPPKVAPKPAPKPAAPAAPSAEKEAEEDEDEELTSPDARLAAMWKQLKLDVQLDVQDTGAAYVIQGHIPGLRNENIKVQLSANRDALIISGARLPSARELDLLKRQRGATSMDALLRMGAGRFGSFSQQFRLPAGVDKDAIGADYSNAVLRVTVPKLQRQEPVPRAFPGPYGSPYTSRRTAAPRGSPFGGGAYPHSGYGAPRSFRDDGDFFW